MTNHTEGQPSKGSAMSDAKRIERFSQPVVSFRASDMTSEPVALVHTSDGPWVKYADHLRALGEAEKLSRANGEALMRMRNRAEAAEEQLRELREGLKQEAQRLSCEIRTVHIADRLYALLDQSEPTK